MTERHEKWVLAEEGQEIPPGQPYREEGEYVGADGDIRLAQEWVSREPATAGDGDTYVDSTWTPPGTSFKVWFIGGKLDGIKTELLATPPYVEVLGERYDRIDDPDTGKYLGGYALHYEGRFGT